MCVSDESSLIKNRFYYRSPLTHSLQQMLRNFRLSHIQVRSNRTYFMSSEHIHPHKQIYNVFAKAFKLTRHRFQISMPTSSFERISQQVCQMNALGCSCLHLVDFWWNCNSYTKMLKIIHFCQMFEYVDMN